MTERFIPAHGGYQTLISYQKAEIVYDATEVTNCLLDRQLRHLEEAFVKEGGLRESMTRARLAERGHGQRP